MKISLLCPSRERLNKFLTFTSSIFCTANNIKNIEIVLGVDEDDKVIGKRGDTVTVYSDQAPSDTVMGQDVFEVIHDKTKDVLLVTIEDIEEL